MPEMQPQADLFRQQWVQWQPRIYAYIRSMVFNRSDAEDLLQEVAEVLWRKLDCYEPGTELQQWAFGVARNKVLNFQKKKGRERARFSDACTELLADDAAAAIAKPDELLDALEACVAKLPDHLRALLRQRYEPDATSRSVAQALGRSESVVSRTLNRIYGLLLACIEASAQPDLSAGSSP